MEWRQTFHAMSSRASHPTKIFSFIRIPPRFAKEYAKFIPKSLLQEKKNKVLISEGELTDLC